MIEYDIRHIFPRFLLEDATGGALCKALEAGINDFLAIVEQGVRMIGDASVMPEWRLDETALELGLPYNYKAEVETKRAWIAKALERNARLGTVDAAKQYANGLFGRAVIEENWQYGGDPYHYRVTVNSQTWQDNAQELLREAMRKAANARSVMDGIAYAVFGASRLRLRCQGSYEENAHAETPWSSRNLIRNLLNPNISALPTINGKMSCTISHTASTAEHGFTSTKNNSSFSYVVPGIVFNGYGSTDATRGLVPGTPYTLSYDAEVLYCGAYPDDTPYQLQAIIAYQTEKDGIRESGAQYIDMGITYRHGQVCTGFAEGTFALPHNTVQVDTINIGQLDPKDVAGSWTMGAGDHFTASNIKLESGIRATEWSAAPEDNA